MPINIVPYTLYIIPKLDDIDKTTKAQEVYNLLLEKGVQVLYDDRNELSIGAKLKDSKVVGIPYVAVFGKTLELFSPNLTIHLSCLRYQSLEQVLNVFLHCK